MKYYRTYRNLIIFLMIASYSVLIYWTLSPDDAWERLARTYLFLGIGSGITIIGVFSLLQLSLRKDN